MDDIITLTEEEELQIRERFREEGLTLVSKNTGITPHEFDELMDAVYEKFSHLPSSRAQA